MSDSSIHDRGVVAASRARLLITARESVRDALSVLLPVRCSGCGAVDRAVCSTCHEALLPAPRRIERAGLALWAGVEYAGAVASVLGAFKDGARTDAAPALAPALREALLAALAETPSGSPLEVATIPSTQAARRARGYVPVELLLRRCGIRSAPVLALARERADQAGLGEEERRLNAAGGLVAGAGARSFGRGWGPSGTPLARLDGRRYLLVDDIVTTGSTLAEAVRALAAAGGETVAIAVLAETPRRFPRYAGSSRETLRDIAAQGGYGGRTGVVDPPFRTG